MNQSTTTSQIEERTERRRRMLDGVPRLLTEDLERTPSGTWVVAGSGPNGRREYKRACALAMDCSRPGYARQYSLATANHGPSTVIRGLPDLYAMFEADAVEPCIETIKMMHAAGVEIWGTQRVQKAAAALDNGLSVAESKTIKVLLPQRAATAGTALLWALCTQLQPEAIYVSGFHGYGATDPALDAEMSVVIDRVTKAFKRTRFTFVGACVMPDCESWRGERVV